MFASVMTTEGQASKEKARHVINQMLPRGQSLPGFKGALILLDETDGKGLAIAFFESEETAQDSGEARARVREDAASAIGANISSVKSYEVLFATGVAESLQV